MPVSVRRAFLCCNVISSLMWEITLIVKQEPAHVPFQRANLVMSQDVLST